MDKVAGAVPIKGVDAPVSDIPAPVRRRVMGRRRRRRPPHALISVVGGISVWQLAIWILEPNPLIIVGPTDVIRDFMDMLASGEIWRHLGVSLRAFSIGYIVCALISIPLGLFIGTNRMVRAYVDPWISALYATPSISLAPLFIVWLGFGVASKVAIVALVAFFPMIINTIAGVLAVDKDLREVGITFDANQIETFFHILLPGSLPYIVAGLRLAIGRGLVGVVVADLFGASSGLGYLILNAAQRFNTSRIFVATMILALLGVTLNSLVLRIEKRVSNWRPDAVGEGMI